MISTLPLSFADDGDRSESGFLVPQPGHVFEFPRDHGSHPSFAIEWWYVTGHLQAGERRFGYQLTFFQLAQASVASGSAEIDGGGAFQADHLHLAHASLSDLSTGKFHHEERLNREGWDATARVGDLDLRNGNWSLRRTTDDRLMLTASIRADVRLNLELSPEKAPVIFGKDGISRKSADPSAASYYITFTRLASKGSLRIEGAELAVSGESWLDHEISSSQLGPDQVGWDWVSMQLNDGREIMAYVLRREDGSFDPVSTLSWIDRQGTVEAVELGPDFQWTPGGEWTSPNTGAVYPIAPSLSTVDPAEGTRRTLRVRPLLADQEVNGKLSGMAYWEGACDVIDENGTVIGKAYLELAGYTPGLRERLRPPAP